MHPKRKWIDISIPIKEGMVHWPNDPAVRIRYRQNMDRGDSCNVSELSFGSHTGPHMDEPRHFFKNAQGLDQMPFDAVIGPCRVVRICDSHCIKKTELEGHKIHQGERILFKTMNSQKCWKTRRFVKHFVYLSLEAAQFLVEKKIRTVGIDYLSMGGSYQGGIKIHQALLKAGIWIIESLNLSKVAAGSYDLICLPLMIVNADGAPARVIVRKR